MEYSTTELFFINLIYTLRGAMLMFFVMLIVAIYPRRKESQVIGELLQILIAITSILFLLCAAFLVPGVSENKLIVNTGKIINMSIVPMVGALLLKIVRPGILNKRRFILLFVPYLVSIASYAITRSSVSIIAIYVFTALLVVVGTYLIVRSSLRYDRYLKNNYSDIRNKSVQWVRSVVYVFLAWYLAWALIVDSNNPAAISMFYVFLVVIWSYIYRKTVRHIFDTDASQALETISDFEVDEQINKYEEPKIDSAELELYMERESPWLNSLLTLKDLALALGTNRTYLSNYFNRTLGVTFYDYLNQYRVSHARKLLDTDSRLSLESIAESSGFNSVTTFRRTFEKQVGMTPASYRKHKKN